MGVLGETEGRCAFLIRIARKIALLIPVPRVSLSAGLAPESPRCTWRMRSFRLTSFPNDRLRSTLQELSFIEIQFVVDAFTNALTKRPYNQTSPMSLK